MLHARRHLTRLSSLSLLVALLLLSLLPSWVIQPASAQDDETILNVYLQQPELVHDPLLQSFEQMMDRYGITLVPVTTYEPPLVWISVLEGGDYRLGLDAMPVKSFLPADTLILKPASEASDIYMMLGYDDRSRAWSFERDALAALAMYALGRCEDAEPHFERAIRLVTRLDARDTDGRTRNSLHILYGNCLLAQDRYDEAVPQFEAGLLKNPEEATCCGEIHAAAAFNLAWTYRQLGQPDAALTILDRLVEAGHNADAEDERNFRERHALHLRIRFLMDAALADRMAIAALTPESASNYYTLGMFYIGMDRPELAQAEFEAYLDRNPDGYEADDVRAYLLALTTILSDE